MLSKFFILKALSTDRIGKISSHLSKITVTDSTKSNLPGAGSVQVENFVNYLKIRGNIRCFKCNFRASLIGINVESPWFADGSSLYVWTHCNLSATGCCHCLPIVSKHGVAHLTACLPHALQANFARVGASCRVHLMLAAPASCRCSDWFQPVITTCDFLCYVPFVIMFYILHR